MTRANEDKGMGFSSKVFFAVSVGVSDANGTTLGVSVLSINDDGIDDGIVDGVEDGAGDGDRVKMSSSSS